MTEGWLQRSVKECGIPSEPSLKTLQKFSLSRQLAPQAVPRLTTDHVREWLASKGWVFRKLPTERRRLHGCTVELDDWGILFYDRSDSELQQRFTFAHEVAHFVLDHRLLRAQLLCVFGPSILPVLALKRPPTPEEVLRALLHRVSFGSRVRLMDRSDSGAPSTGEAMTTEARADLLAFEILAPEHLAKPLIKNRPMTQAVEALVERFGLPSKEAHAYACQLRLREPTPRPFFLDSLIEEMPEHG